MMGFSWLCKDLYKFDSSCLHGARDCPAQAGMISPLFYHKPAFDSTLSLNVCHPRFVWIPSGTITYLMRDCHKFGIQSSSSFSLLHISCSIDSQSEVCSTIHKATIAPVFPNKVFEGNDICRMCFSGKFREYKIITCNYGNFCKGNHLNLFPLRNGIALLTAFGSFQEINAECLHYFEWTLQLFPTFEITPLIHPSV